MCHVDNQRMWDLLRHQRAELLDAGLVTYDEYFELAKDHSAVKRLEDYDAAVNAAVAAKLREIGTHLFQKAIELRRIRIEANQIISLGWDASARYCHTQADKLLAPPQPAQGEGEVPRVSK